MEIAASVGPTLDATAGENTWRSSMGKKARPAVSTMPTSRAPTRAPRMEPMPPMTMHTSTRIRMSSPMPTCTEVMGPSSAPATAASMAPSVNTPRNSSGTRTPISVAIWRLEAPDGHADGRARAAAVPGRVHAGRHAGGGGGGAAGAHHLGAGGHGRGHPDPGAGVHRHRRHRLHTRRPGGRPAGGHGGYGGAGLFAHAAAPGVLAGRGIQRGAYAGGDFHLRADGGGAGVPSFRPFPCARLSMEHSTLQGRFQARFFWTVLALLALAVFPLVAPALGLDFYISFVRRVLIDRKSTRLNSSHT